MGKDKN